MLSRTTLTAVCAAASFCVAAAAPAAPFYEITHTGSTNPQLENWRAIDIVASTQTEFTLPRPGIGPVNDGGVEAWQINDPTTSPSDTSAYWANGIPLTTNVLLANHWKFSTRVKALPSDETVNAPLNSAFRIMAYSHANFGTQYGYIWLVTLEDVADSGTHVRINGSSGNNVDHAITDGYHTIDLIYDPTLGTNLYIDGQLIQQDVANSLYAPIGNRVEFGDLQLVNGGSGGANWASVYFAYDDQPFSPSPEPASLAILLGGLTLLTSRRRAKLI